MGGLGRGTFGEGRKIYVGQGDSLKIVDLTEEKGEAGSHTGETTDLPARTGTLRIVPK
jgi:hypothetical protein